MKMNVAMIVLFIYNFRSNQSVYWLYLQLRGFVAELSGQLSRLHVVSSVISSQAINDNLKINYQHAVHNIATCKLIYLVVPWLLLSLPPGAVER